MTHATWHTLIQPARDRLAAAWQPGRRGPLAVCLGFALLLLWAYAPAFAEMAERWVTDPQYSHGFFVPVFAAVVLYVRHVRFPDVACRPSAWGLLWLLGATAMRLTAAALYYEWLDALSLLPALAGICALLGGNRALRWAWPGIAFLAFMMPAPYQLEVALAQPLQRVATGASTYLLQTAGLPAVAEGNVILIPLKTSEVLETSEVLDVQLGVTEACSGLGMLITFFALSTAVALVLSRGWVERAVVFFSAIPVALLANIVRITLTGILYATAGSDVARVVYHDLAGWLMMPLALVVLWLELKFLERLFLDDEPDAPLALGGAPVRQTKKPLPQPLPEAARGAVLSSPTLRLREGIGGTGGLPQPLPEAEISAQRFPKS